MAEEPITTRPGFLSRHFSFHSMIASTLIKVIYILGLIVVVGISIYSILNGIMKPAMDLQEVAIGLIGLTGGILAWRLMCEWWILLFAMHERLSKIESSQEAFAKYVDWYQKKGGGKRP